MSCSACGDSDCDSDLFENFYRCPECGEEWEDIWCGQPDDQCPNCGLKAIQPYESDDA